MKPQTILIALLVICLSVSCNAEDKQDKGKQTSSGSDVSVSVNTGRTIMTSSLELSTTLTHNSFKSAKYQEATDRAKQLLREGIDCIGQFTMDWGAGNTCPSKDNYNFSKLDERVRLIHGLDKKVVLTFCRCPQWMRRDDPQKGVDAAPRQDMYKEFAHMTADFIRHYDEIGIGVYAVNVWSETRGYWSKTLNRWELEDYAVLFNEVYDSIKSVNSSVLVGGPFMHVESSPKGKNMADFSGNISSSDRKALTAFLDNVRELDFFSIDRNLKENADNTPYSKDEVLKYTAFNGVVHQETRELLNGRFNHDVPVWVVDNQCLKGHYPTDVEAAGLASMYRWHLLGGAAFVDKWQPEDEGSESTDSEQIAPEGMYTHIDSDNGAQPLPTFYVFKAFRDYFPRGTQIVESVSDSEWVETLASKKAVMLINKHSVKHEISINIDGKESKTVLNGFEVKTIEL